jgi:hypothetical protein
MSDLEHCAEDDNKCSAFRDAANGKQTCASSIAAAAMRRQNHHKKEISSSDDVNHYHSSKNLRGLSLLLICCIIACFIMSSPTKAHDSNNNAQRVRMMRAASSSTAASVAAANSVENQQQRSNNQKHADLFLLSGQSDMVGHTTSGQSITSSGDYWNKLKSILERGGNFDTMEDKLYNAIYEANYNPQSDSNEQVARTLTEGVMDLYKSDLLNDLDTPLQFGKCSFQEADNSNVEDVSQGTVPAVWDANCGHSFGHELLLSRTMELAMNYTTEFEMHKVARGGSGLYEHWYPNHGMHWNLLKNAIEQRQGQGDWKGFIWHQGSQETWSEKQYGEDRSLTYHGNLTGLVEEVRELMFQNSISWQCKEEIPVVIVQVGFWPGRAAAGRTRDAQAKFCDEDPRAVLVKTDDLARFYHYDVASFLISGNRIAHAYQKALQGVVQCPGKVVTSSPTGSPSSQPSASPSSKSSSIPTTSPSVASSYVPTADIESSYIPTQSDFVSSHGPTQTDVESSYIPTSDVDSSYIPTQTDVASSYVPTSDVDSSYIPTQTGVASSYVPTPIPTSDFLDDVAATSIPTGQVL